MIAASWIPTRRLAWLCTLTLVACGEPPAEPTALAPSFHRDGGRNRTIVVDPKGRHDATTIQAGIDMAPAGGRVQVMPGTYPESLVVDKGITLEAADDGITMRYRAKHHAGVIIAPPGAPTIAVQVATTEPVTIRGLTLHYTGLHGIRGDGLVDLTVERATVVAVNPPLGASLLVSVFNNPPTTGPARLVVRESNLDGSTAFANSSTPPFPQTFGIGTRGVVDAVIEGNTIRRAGGACINVQTELTGDVNADILNNDLDECYPSGRAGASHSRSQRNTAGPLGRLHRNGHCERCGEHDPEHTWIVPYDGRRSTTRRSRAASSTTESWVSCRHARRRRPEARARRDLGGQLPRRDARQT